MFFTNRISAPLATPDEVYTAPVATTTRKMRLNILCAGPTIIVLPSAATMSPNQVDEGSV